MILTNRVLLLIAVAIFSGCSSSNTQYVYKDKFPDDKIIAVKTDKNLVSKLKYKPLVSKKEYETILDKQRKMVEDKDHIAYIENSLMEFYKEWQGVRYKFGGNSKKGIDCSAFTQKAFKEKFDLDIPRTTRTQVRIGKTIKKSQLEFGDLVFFKTGKIDRHVGIYIGDGKFMHASIKGVKVSRLNKPFYKKAYWTSKRLIY